MVCGIEFVHHMIVLVGIGSLLMSSLHRWFVV